MMMKSFRGIKMETSTIENIEKLLQTIPSYKFQENVYFYGILAEIATIADILKERSAARYEN